VIIEYKCFDKIKDKDNSEFDNNIYIDEETTRYYNSKSSEVLKSPTQIKEYVNDIVIKFFESIL